MKILHFAGGSIPPSELEDRYGSKYVYEVVGKLVDAGLVAKREETYALTTMGVEEASTLVREDEEFIQRLTGYLSGGMTPVASKYGLKNFSPRLGRLYVETGIRFAEGSRLGNVLDASEAVAFEEAPRGSRTTSDPLRRSPRDCVLPHPCRHDNHLDILAASAPGFLTCI